jgi:predicted acylesterase/phospholipase RssA
VTGDMDANPGALGLLSLCDLFSDIDPAELSPSEAEILAAEVEIVRMSRGDVLMRQGDASDCMYALVSGRLQVVVEGPDRERILVGELRSGETVGELGLIDGSARMATVLATRDSLLVRVSAAGFDRLVRSNVESLIKIARAEAGRMRSMGQRRSPAGVVRSIAVIGDSRNPAFHRFTAQFCEKLAEIGSTLHLSASKFEAMFGAEFGAGDAIAAWLSALETAHRFVVCQAEWDLTPWTLHSLRQADRVLSVHDSSASPGLSRAEQSLMDEIRPGVVPPMELVLLHEKDGAIFPGTSRWLTSRRLLRHHHVRLARPNDTGRIARLLAGRAIGLAFGGGGARGFAHIGVVRALDDAGIPLDMVGGVSMGAIIAALYAMGNDWREILALAGREMTRKMTSDFTLPIVSLGSGRKFRRVLETFFKGHDIEDLGLSYFCSSCNLSTSELMIHRTGSLLESVHASNAVPLLLPPVLMGGHMLIDGGVLNNQPGDVLKELCGGSVIVTNVSPRRDATVDASFTKMPSAWRILRSRVNPFEPAIKVPGLSATMIRTIMVASNRKSREVEQLADFYLRPPVERFRLDDYARIAEIAQTAYDYSIEEIRQWKESGRYPLPPGL